MPKDPEALDRWVDKELGFEQTGIGMDPDDQRPDGMPRATKQGTVYLHVLPRNDGYQTQYQCVDCPMWLSDTERCTIHGPEDVIRAVGSCGYWVPGASVTSATHEPMGSVTPIQSGYVENAPGLSCKRCAAYAPLFTSDGSMSVKGGCFIVDFNTPGDDPGIIHPNACCADWTPDDPAAGMASDEFPTIVETA